MIRHDRSVINEYGGIWPVLADAVRADSEAIVAGLMPTGALVRYKPPPRVPPRNCVRGDLRERRQALGLPSRALAAMVGCAKSSITETERYGKPRGMIARIEAALAKAEAERDS